MEMNGKPTRNIISTNSSDIKTVGKPRNFVRIKSRFQWKSFRNYLTTACCQGLILGVLVASIALAVVTTLYLRSNHRTLITDHITEYTLSITNMSSSVTTTSVTTTVTSITSTKTTSISTTSSTATISNICIGGTTYTTQLLYLSLNAVLSWTKYSFNCTALNMTSATLTFSFRNDPSFWYLDDISVTNSSGKQLLLNRGFEFGDLSYWTYCNPKSTSYAGDITSSKSYQGLYSYADGSVNGSDYLSQSFTVIPNNIYSVSFWLAAGSNRSSFALITVSN